MSPHVLNWWLFYIPEIQVSSPTIHIQEPPINGDTGNRLLKRASKIITMPIITDAIALCRILLPLNFPLPELKY